MRELILIHGRSQQHKDVSALKGEWIAALRDGLDRAGLSLDLNEDHIRFPFYGDTLYALDQGLSADRVPKVVVRGALDNVAERDFMQAVLGEVTARFNLDDVKLAEVAGGEINTRGVLNWGWVQAILRAIDRHVPYGSGASVALFTHDVYTYLTNLGIRDQIESGVRKALQAGSSPVVVAHSLGTVVAYNLLRREGEAQGWKVPLFVTLGSPLAVRAIRQRLRPIAHPACVTGWFNAMDPNDVVSLYPLDRDHFDVDPEIENFAEVDNPTANQHGISGYLSDPEVARRIHRALTS